MRDHPTFTYEEWRASAVFVSDLRPFEKTLDGMDGYEFWRCGKPVPGALFFYTTPCGDVEPLSMQPMEGPNYHQAGVIQQLDDGRWYVIVGNQDPTYGSFEMAARYLWNAHWKSEIGTPPQMFRLMSFDREGETETDRRCTWDGVVETIKKTFGDSADEVDRCLSDLGHIGQRFHEFSAGHFICIPVEED